MINKIIHIKHSSYKTRTNKENECKIEIIKSLIRNYQQQLGIKEL